MADQQSPIDETGTLTEEEIAAAEARDPAKRGLFGQTGDRIDQTMGHMGGAGASGSGPDISHQSQPTPGNSSDEPSR